MDDHLRGSRGPTTGNAKLSVPASHAAKLLKSDGAPMNSAFLAAVGREGRKIYGEEWRRAAMVAPVNHRPCRSIKSA